MTRHNRLYNIWCHIKKRCCNSKDKNYPHYGGRGIKVCDEWLHDFDAFQKWALDNGYSDTLTIDRIDNNGNYCPENCRWITHDQQQRNRTNNIRIEIDGVSKTISELSRKLNIKDKILYKRYHSAILHKGSCTIEDLITSPNYPKIYTDRYKNRKPRPSRVVEQYTKDNIYICSMSLVEARNKGFNPKCIHASCAGRTKTACGYIWKYTDKFVSP